MSDLEKIYKLVKNSEIEQSANEKEFVLSNALQSLYGEITEKGVNQLIEKLREHRYLTNQTTFVDVGSGYGKMVFHMAMFDEIKRSKGIEFLKSKFKYSVDLLKSLSPKYPLNKVKLMFGNILDVKELDEDIVFHNSISWANEHLNHLINITKPSSIHISSNNLIYKTKRKDIKEIHRWKISCSWNKGGKLTPMYVYKKL